MIQRSFLKWAGGKAKIAHKISSALPKARVLVEPFVGGGSVFMNTDYEYYILSDINPDLISLYRMLKYVGANQFIKDLQAHLFTPEQNSQAQFLKWRDEFNTTSDSYKKALIFVYLNRHGFNGLCRYNKNGIFNVSFGSYKAPYLPEAEIRAFEKKISRIELHCWSFACAFEFAPADSVIYCDPPYVPLSATSNFTSYSADGFTAIDQQKLADLAMSSNVPVVISNHDTPFTRALYKSAAISAFDVQRNISQNGGNRGKAKELIAVFTPGKIHSNSGKLEAA